MLRRSFRCFGFIRIFQNMLRVDIRRIAYKAILYQNTRSYFIFIPPPMGQETPALTSSTRAITPWSYYILVKGIYGSNREQRKPMLLLLLSGLFLLRLAARRLFSLLLFHEPPRSTPLASLQNRQKPVYAFLFGNCFYPTSQQFIDFNQRTIGKTILRMAG